LQLLKHAAHVDEGDIKGDRHSTVVVTHGSTSSEAHRHAEKMDDGVDNRNETTRWGRPNEIRMHKT